MSGRVVTVGNAMVDLIAVAPRLPERGGDVLATAGRVEVGGGGYRAIAAARAAGADAVFAGRIGTGPFGDLVQAELRRLGVPAPLPQVARVDTGFVHVVVEPDGERTFVTVPGAESAEPLLDGVALRPGDLLHVHGYGLVDPGRAAAVVDLAVRCPNGAVVLLDPGPFGAATDPTLLARLLQRVDWWSGNEDEALAATGAADADAAARLLATACRAGAVVRRGAAGCLLAVRGAAPDVLPAPAVVPVDTTGAGDTHVGTFLAALARGTAPAAAAALANRAAARQVAAAR